VDAEDLIVSTLFEGADACRNGIASPVAVDAYRNLRALIAGVLPRNRQALIDLAETDPPARGALLTQALRETGAGADKDMIAVAQRLRDLLRSPGAGQTPGKAEPVNSLNREPGRVGRRLPTVSGRCPSSDLDEAGRIVSRSQQLSSRTADLLAQARHVGNRTADGLDGVIPDVRRNAPGLVILVDGCSGIQVGKDNDQLSVYQLTVSAAALASAAELAELLLAPGTPWAQDIFGHDAELPPLASPRRPDPDSRGIVHGPGGNVLVIVRNSRGVQIGDHNIQRNEFQVRVAAVSVWADQVEENPRRRAAINRLREDPDDQDAARELAADIAAAAGASLQADLMVLLVNENGDPYVRGLPQELTGVTGRQVGEQGHARVEVKAAGIATFDTHALAHEISHAARQVSLAEAELTRNLSALPPPPPMSAI
jgi:hypothetical protein